MLKVADAAFFGVADKAPHFCEIKVPAIVVPLDIDQLYIHSLRADGSVKGRGKGREEQSVLTMARHVGNIAVKNSVKCRGIGLDTKGVTYAVHVEPVGVVGVVGGELRIQNRQCQRFLGQELAVGEGCEGDDDVIFARIQCPAVGIDGKPHRLKVIGRGIEQMVDIFLKVTAMAPRRVEGDNFGGGRARHEDVGEETGGI